MSLCYTLIDGIRHYLYAITEHEAILRTGLPKAGNHVFRHLFLTTDRAQAMPVSFAEGMVWIHKSRCATTIVPHFGKFLEGRGLVAKNDWASGRARAIRQIQQVPARGGDGFHIQWATGQHIGIADGELCVSATPVTLHMEDAPPTEVELLREQLDAVRAENAELRALLAL